jgi:hypothetical protein
VSYNGFITDFCNFNGFRLFDDEFGGVQIEIESLSGWLPNEDIKMSSAPGFGFPGRLIGSPFESLLASL